MNDKIRLVIDVVGKDEKPDISLRENSEWNTLSDYRNFSLAFRKKPSGATSIKAYYFVNEDDKWTEIDDLLNRKDIEYNQSATLYGFVNILHPAEYPLSDYNDGLIPKFSIGIIIEGGVFDNERIILPWPGEYNPPEEIFEPDSSEGNRGDVGTDDDKEDSSDNDGQHPNIPESKPDKDNEVAPSQPVMSLPSELGNNKILPNVSEKSIKDKQISTYKKPIDPIEENIGSALSSEKEGKPLRENKKIS